jgi:hypothetical protein
MSSRSFVRTFVVLALIAGCHKRAKGPPPEITGLAAIPASAEALVVIDVPRVVDAPLVSRAVDMLVARDPALASNWQKLHDSCKLDVKNVDHVTLAIGPHVNGPNGPDGRPITGPVLLVATGHLVENDLASCVRTMVGQGGGSLTAKPVGAHTLYEAKDGNRVMYFAFGRADTVLMSASEAFVTEALGDGKKVTDNAEMSKWVGMADQKAPVWAAGRADERVKQGMVKVVSGQISAGPTAYTAAFDPSSGAKLELDAIMANPADAKALESFAKAQLGALGMVAQAKSLGTIVDKIAISADGATLRLKATLNQDEVNQLISALDAKGSASQDTPPAGSGSGAGSQGK